MHCMLTNYFFHEKSRFFQTRNSVRWMIFYVVADLFSISWTSGDPWILLPASAFSLLSYYSSCSLWKTLVYICEETRMKKAKNDLVLWKQFWSLRPPERILRIPKGLGQHFENLCFRVSKKCSITHFLIWS